MENTNIERIENLCKEYGLPIFQNPRDNLMTLIESAEPSDEEKLEAFDIYDEWLIEMHCTQP